MTTREDRQEAMSRAYALAVAARCGLTHSTKSKDYGIDLTLHEVVENNGRFEEGGRVLDLQLKSTTTAVITPSVIRYDLSMRAYDLLRRPSFQPRALALLVLPEEEDEWIDQTELGLVLRGCMYWLTLPGAPAITNRRSVRLEIPRTQVFTCRAIDLIMGPRRPGSMP